MCISGSVSSCTMFRSSSISSPCVSISTGLPNWRERSRTIRAMRLNSGPMGTSRMAMAVFCNSAVMRVNCAMLRCRRGLFSAARSGSWRTSDCAMTISPAMSTRIVELGGVHFHRHRFVLVLGRFGGGRGRRSAAVRAACFGGGRGARASPAASGLTAAAISTRPAACRSGSDISRRECGQKRLVRRAAAPTAGSARSIPDGSTSRRRSSALSRMTSMAEGVRDSLGAAGAIQDRFGFVSEFLDRPRVPETRPAL